MSGKSNFSTGNASRHLNKDHPDEFLRDALREDGNVFVSVLVKKKLKLNYPLNDEYIYKEFSQEKFRKKLIQWIDVNDQPFTEPQQWAFVEVVKALSPDAEIISDKAVRSDILSTYQEKLENIKDQVSHILGKISITIDGWTS